MQLWAGTISDLFLNLGWNVEQNSQRWERLELSHLLPGASAVDGVPDTFSLLTEGRDSGCSGASRCEGFRVPSPKTSPFPRGIPVEPREQITKRLLTILSSLQSGPSPLCSPGLPSMSVCVCVCVRVHACTCV